jgi:hypothetical protein
MRKVWLYKKADFNKINNEILEFQWEQFLHKSTDIEDMSNRFMHKYLEMVGRGIPSRLKNCSRAYLMILLTLFRCDLYFCRD